MERSGSSASTASSIVDFIVPRVWNPMIELLFHPQIGGIFELFDEEIGLARIALS